MIELSYCSGEVLVFDVEDWASLRKTNRILGIFIGNTNKIQTLPLKLLPEEVLLLVDKGIAKVVDRKFDIASKDELKQRQFEDDLFEQEKLLYRDIRKRQLEAVIDDIVAAKRKRGDTRTSNEIIADELEKSTQITKDNMIWPVRLKSEHTGESVNITREQLLVNTSELKYHTFKDLWEKGYYVTGGFKFGADFLVYLGDPVAYHAIFIVHCVEDPDKAIHSTEIVAFGRLANSVKKRAILASMKEGEVSYITINWIDA